jgi:flagellin
MADRVAVQDDLLLDEPAPQSRPHKKSRVQAQRAKKEIHKMALTVLNNISSLSAENALSSTQANLQKTLTQLSTGLKINSGSDDAAGLSIATGLTANIAALTQSQQNASNGIGMLQTADGALSEVTSLLNRAVTLATEGASSGITATQTAALQKEFSTIQTEINTIGQTTNFNGQNVFAAAAPKFDSTQGTKVALTTATLLQSGSVTTVSDATTGGTLVFKAKADGTSAVSDLQAAIEAAATAGTLSTSTDLAINGTGQVEITGGAGASLNVTTTDGGLGQFVGTTPAGGSGTVYMGDGVSSSSLATTVGALSTTALGIQASTLSAGGAAAALTAVTAALNTVSAQRGVIGASVNQLNAANTVMSSAVTNLQSAANSLQNADIGKTVANMTAYNVLQSTGMAALQQSNQAQQAVLKLVQ